MLRKHLPSKSCILSSQADIQLLTATADTSCSCPVTHGGCKQVPSLQHPVGRAEQGGWGAEQGGWGAEQGGWGAEQGDWGAEQGGWGAEQGGWGAEQGGWGAEQGPAPSLAPNSLGQGELINSLPAPSVALM